MPKTGSVEIYLPGLKDLVSAAKAENGFEPRSLSSFARLFSRANCEQSTELNPIYQLSRRYNFVFDSDAMPLAALSYYFHNNVKPAYVVFLDPVHLKPDRDHLILFGPDSLHLTLQEAQLLLQEIEQCYQDLGWKIECHTANNWLLTLKEDPGVVFHPLIGVIGKSVAEFLPSGLNKSQWLRISNEIQMLLHNHSTNLKRERVGQLSVNSVWFWGGGSIQSLPKSTISTTVSELVSTQTCLERLWSDDSCAAGLAKLAGRVINDLPADANLCIDAACEYDNQQIFLDLDHWNEASSATMTATDKLSALHRAWIMPLLDAVAAKKIDRLRLYDDQGRCYSINRQQLKRWWKPLRLFYHFW